MKKIMNMMIIIFLTGCTTSSWTHKSNNNSNLEFDSGFCRSYANVNEPTYICKDPFMCSPEELSTAIIALGQNKAAYDLCMYKKGYKQ
tara:strand:+ start:250 stop:513 length:264 start_codon:yes stop_codon:yes gene_type:complete